MAACVRLLIAALAPSAALACGGAASAQAKLQEPWPASAAVENIMGEQVSFPSSSPFAPEDIGQKDDAAPAAALATLFTAFAQSSPRCRWR
jgi:hypothetical protein